jgi:hypothetical protein
MVEVERLRGPAYSVQRAHGLESTQRRKGGESLSILS